LPSGFHVEIFKTKLQLSVHKHVVPSYDNSRNLATNESFGNAVLMQDLP